LFFQFRPETEKDNKNPRNPPAPFIPLNLFGFCLTGMKPFFLLFHRGLTGVPKKEKSVILNNANKESLTP